MLSTDMFIVTPFYREQIIITGVLTEQPEIPFTSYSVFCFRTRLESFLRTYLKSLYNYNTFTFHDVPSQDKMITTLEMLDVNDIKLRLSTQEIRDINQEIGKITTLNPNYCLFFEKTNEFPQAWLQTIIPSFQFERTEYYADDSSKTFVIPTKFENGKIYLDLSDDMNYLTTIKNLYADFMELLEKYFYSGTIPDMVEVSADNFQRIPGKFVHFKDKTGEEVLDELAELEPLKIPVSDIEFISDVKIKNKNPNQSTVFVLNFTKTDPDMNIFIDPIGVEFLTSLKQFLRADDVFVQEVAPAYFEIELKKDGAFVQSNINIKEMFGYFYLTDHPMGLLVAEDMDLLEDSRIIYDSNSGKGGLFIPMIFLDEPIQKDLVKIQLENRIKTVDVYTKTPELELILKKLGLKIISSIDNYFYVEKTEWITKRVVYRAIKNYPPQTLIAGSWNFETMQPKVIIDFANEFIKSNEVEEGPFSTLKVPVNNLDNLKQLMKYLEEQIELKYHPTRKF